MSREYICIICRKIFTGNSLTGIFENAFCSDKCLEKYYKDKKENEQEQEKEKR